MAQKTELETQKISLEAGEDRSFTIPYRQKVKLTGFVEGDSSDGFLDLSAKGKGIALIKSADSGQTVYKIERYNNGKTTINESLILGKGVYYAFAIREVGGSAANARLDITYKEPVVIYEDNEKRPVENENNVKDETDDVIDRDESQLEEEEEDKQDINITLTGGNDKSDNEEIDYKKYIVPGVGVLLLILLLRSG